MKSSALSGGSKVLRLALDTNEVGTVSVLWLSGLPGQIGA
jgi:hypothetical protein